MADARSNRGRIALSLLLIAGPLCGAATLSEEGSRALRTGGYLWQASAPRGQVRIVIDRVRQRAYVYRGEALIGMSTASTGKKGHRTPTGTFTILQKRERHRSNKYSNAPMPFMQRLTWDGIALHAGPLPGYPASHGCIRLPWAFAQKLFALTSLGAVVEITDSGPQLPRVQMASAPATIPVVQSASAMPVALPATAVTPLPASAEAPRPAALAEAAPIERPGRASWREQSAEDYVTWGSSLPPRAPAG